MQPTDLVHIIFLSLEIVSLTIFIFFVVKYTRRFKDSKDPYTIACFTFIIIAMTTRISLKVFSMIPKQCNDNIEECRTLENIANCASLASYYLTIGFLTVAILINVIRWILLIIQYKREPKPIL